MSNFNVAILFVLKNEGGYSNVKYDKGGATNYGISTRFLKQIDEDIDGDGHVTSEDVKHLTHSKVLDLYKVHFWDHYKLQNIRTIGASSKALDLFVNMRGKSAAKILQNACNDCGHNLKVDGILGKKSFLAINNQCLFTVKNALFMAKVRERQAEFYKAIVENNKKQKKFLKGWLARAAR